MQTSGGGKELDLSEEGERSQKGQHALMGDPATYIFNRCLKIHISRLKILILASLNLFYLQSFHLG